MRRQHVLSSLFAILLLPISFSSATSIKQIPSRNVGLEFAVAIERGDLDRVKALIKEGNKPDTPIDSSGGASPLINAIHEGQLEIAAYLLSAGANINFVDSRGFTALYLAVFLNRTERVKFLIEKGADVNVRDGLESPIGRAAAWGNIEIVKMLINAKADLASESRGHTPIMVAASNGQTEMVEFLVKQGVSVNQTSKLTGRTAIFGAIHSQRVEVVRALIRLKADVNVRSKLEETPLKEALQWKNTEIIEMLKAAGAKN